MTADERYAEAAESNACEHCGRHPVTWREWLVLIGASAVISALSIIALLVIQEAGR